MKFTNKPLLSLIAIVCITAIVMCSVQIMHSPAGDSLYEDSDQNESSDEEANPDNGQGNQNEGSDMIKMIVQIGNKNFSAVLYNNPSTMKFLEMLPLEITMNELNGNEKYYYLHDSIPTHIENVRDIHTGDLMLYGSDCLVLFYENFSTSYGYTKLGYIENSEDLKEALGNRDVNVIFSIV